MNQQFLTTWHETFGVFNPTRWSYNKFVLSFLNRLLAPCLRANILVASFNYQNSPLITCYRTCRFIHLLRAFWRAFPSPTWCKSLIIIKASRSQTRHTRQESSGRVISLTQKPLPDSTQHSQSPAGIRARNHGKRAAATHALDGAATGCGAPQ